MRSMSLSEMRRGLSLPATAPVEVVSDGFMPSKYQQKIFDWIESGTGDAFVQAVAGSGKSTTLIQASRRIPSHSSIFLAFNKHIVDALRVRLPQGFAVSTIHGVGFGILRQSFGALTVEDDKYLKIARQLLIDNNIKDKDGDLAQLLRKYCELAQATLTDASSALEIMGLLGHFDDDDLEPNEVELLIESLDDMHELGIKQAIEGKVVSYGDMIWLPNMLKLKGKAHQWVFVDEAQDLSAAQLGIVLSCRADSGRIIFVGDERQAIMGFAGADSGSVQNIISQTKATELPLSICYRCPSSHIALAKEIVPQIEAAPSAAAGIVEPRSYEQMILSSVEGDMVVARVTAPLITAAYEMIGMSKPARVRGRDIGKSLVSILKKITKAQPDYPIEQALFALSAYRDIRASKIGDDPAKLLRLNDQIQSLAVIYAESQPTSWDDYRGKVESLFSDDGRGIVLSTIHRAKGLEADRVFFLEPNKVPHPMAMRSRHADVSVGEDWRLTQEYNLKYVALTRAKSELYLVSGK